MLTLPKTAKHGLLRLIMNRSVQRALLPFGHTLQPEKWIFVLGCYNSATTLLASILRKHPLVGGLPNEGAFLTDVLPYPELYGWPRMWSQCLDKMHIDHDFNNAQQAQRIKKQWSLWFPKDTPNLIEKSISNINRTEFLQEHFSPAYFIHIVRNGYVVSKGIQKKANYSRWNCPYKENGYPIELCAEQWRKSDEVISQASEKLKRIIFIRYEDFTEKPLQILQSITDFLEIPPMPKKILDQEWSVHGLTSTIKNMNSAGLSRLDEEDFEKIKAVAGKVLEKYGYDNTI